MGYTLNFDAVWRNFDDLLWGLGLSLYLAVVAIGIGCAFGLVLAFCRVGPMRLLSIPANAYVTLFRNLPLLVIVLFSFFALPQLGLRLSKENSFVLALALYSAAYLAEVFRGGLLSVPKGLREAGLAIGLTEGQIRRRIILPVMFRAVLPALGSTFIGLFKDTSLAAAIAVPELTFEARKINVETFRVVETWIVASALYIATCSILAALLRRIEARLATSR
ncbi:amino acid ABC transporter permease [Aurantimonas endophytica]|uniref:Polar amino acid transport system permease protein n=1 Tax=Aurantimonas endophytica TaxID=1522175 RepID=A0A7W6HHM9_9HYPH|nr:amino acid ABC transporter permease [Aurantimonas endophytica]MBB4005379.1 polar amino acid transport system permease protein [Aurantimonas endophytica]MCO6405960.1 ABC transporter permease subunit [Aurantimonas endophytica]